MPRPAPSAFPLTRLVRSSLPLQEQLYARIRSAIAKGQLRPGEKLPSARTMASALGVARGTVDMAFMRLAGEGYLLARGPAGTIVSPALSIDRPVARTVPARISESVEAASDARPFQMGLPALDLFPRALWARLTSRAAKQLAGPALSYPEILGLPELRTAIASYLAVSRGVSCSAAQIIVTGGYQSGLGLIAQALLSPGDPVWFEEPGYVFARQVLQAASAQPVPIPVDGQGMDVEAGFGAAPQARLAVVTPAHHSALGVALSLARRQRLLAWAASAGAWVVEDDYDGEFHYVGRKLPALKSLDAADRVIYAGSFSKTLFPGLRLGYLVVPRQLLPRFAETKSVTTRGEPTLGQKTVADFIVEGHFGRHLKRMRGLYAQRREALATALREVFGERLSMTVEPGGMHLLARFAGAASDVELVRRAARHGLSPTALSTQYLGRSRDSGLLLGFTNVVEERAPALARTLARAIG